MSGASQGGQGLSIVNNDTQTDNYQQYLTGGPTGYGQGSSSSANSFIAGQGSQITLSQQSPQALALAGLAIQSAAQQSMQAQSLLSTAAQSASDTERFIAAKSLDTAAASLPANASDIIRNLGLVILALALLALLVWYLLRGK